MGSEHEHDHEYYEGMVSFNDMSNEQREQVTHNILLVEMLLEQFTDQVVDHIRFTNNNCVRSCIGAPTTLTMAELPTREVLMVLTLALRKLAELRLESEEGS